jgi:hypothetical protein
VPNHLDHDQPFEAGSHWPDDLPSPDELITPHNELPSRQGAKDRDDRDFYRALAGSKAGTRHFFAALVREESCVAMGKPSLIARSR